MSEGRGPTRISWSIGRKFTDGNYGSVDIHHSISADVEMDETVDEANKRIFTQVEKDLAKAIEYKSKQLRSEHV